MVIFKCNEENADSEILKDKEVIEKVNLKDKEVIEKVKVKGSN